MEEIINTTTQTPIEIALGIDEHGMTTARKLYEFLEMDKSHYSRWYKQNIINNAFAAENEDYFPFAINGECGGQASKDAKLTADFAKKLSMTAKNEKGEEARCYFVAVENMAKKSTIAWNETINKSLLELKEMIAVQSLQISPLASAVTELCITVKDLISDKKEKTSAYNMTDGSAITVEEAVDYLRDKGITIDLDSLYSLMIENKMIRATRSKWRLPLKKALTDGLLTTRKCLYEVDDVTKAYEETMITPIGMEFIESRLCC
ncbi:antA/AntB antirepressor family protein [[Clostridium] innocuum]|nr:antA/AntB antirepressor family protein [[Clostridium] innocuum]MCR0601640.1 antA/AntB antirepressor family protein [[Clostridium] innocuum]